LHSNNKRERKVPWREAAVLLGACLAALPLQAATPAGSIVSLQGKGEFRGSQATAWQPARVQQELARGDFVRTGDLSSMGILFLPERMQIRLSQNSLLQIKTAAESASDTQNLIRLNQGRSWGAARGAPRLAPGQPPLRVETPAVTLAIRGTDWELEVGADGRTQLVVLSGEVEMSNPHGELRLGSGEAALAEVGRPPVRILIANPRERVQWMVRWRQDPQRYAGEPPAVARLLMSADEAVVAGRLDEAVALARRAAEADPGGIARAQLARLLLLADRPQEAQAALAPPHSVETRVAEGEVARFEGDAPRARAAYREATALAPQDARGWGGLGAIAVEREEVALARELLAKAQALDPRESEYLAERGTLEAFANRHEAASAAFDAALALQPDDFIALTGRGVTRLKRGETARALDDFLAAELVAPRYARAQLFLGVAHYQLGHHGRALEALARAAELDGSDPLPPLFASMILTDLFDAEGALAQAREAMRRMPGLKSLNQVANNQRGVANLGNALAFRGLKEWAMAYAQDSYYPFWAGSHLFLADQYDGSFAKNSELFQGFLADPAVFGASNRFQSLIERPGHYQSLALVAGRDREIAEYVPRITLNGLAEAAGRLAYFVDADVQRGRARSSEGFDYADRTRSLTAALGWVPRHELRFFGYYSSDRIDSTYGDGGIRDLAFDATFADIAAGFTWLPAPTHQLQLRVGQNRVDGTQDWLDATLAPTLANRFEDREVARDAQLGWRRRWNDAWDLAAGLEYAESPEDSLLAVRLQPAGTLAFVDDSHIAEKSRIGYLSALRLFGPADYVQLDLVASEYEKRVTHDTELFGVTGSQASEWRYDRVSPRLGLTHALGRGHRVRLAYQDFSRSSARVTLGPVATAGIPLDETLVRYGGRVRRAAARLESELSPRLYAELGVERSDARNPDSFDLSLAESLANLTRLRQRNVAEAASFYAGAPTSEEYSTANLNTRAALNQARAALNAALTPTLAGSALVRFTDSDLTLLDEGGFYLPKRELGLGLTWVSPSRWRLAGDALWRSRSHTFADVAAPREAYWSANVSAYWETQDKRLSFALFAKDLASPHASTFFGGAASARF
jgi:tetratricopeptide (TPR) repeat protein